MRRGSTTISAGRLLAIRRRVLSVAGGVLVLLTSLLLVPAPGAQAQTPRAAAIGKLRLLSVSMPPLADPNLPEGGLALALVNAGFARLGGGAAPQSDVQWATGGLTQELLADPSIDLFLPVESADCDRPNELAHAAAVVCDHAAYSEPILQVVLGLFTLTNSSFKFDGEQSILSKTICVSRENDLSALNANGRNWASYKRINVLWRPTLLDCIVAVQAHDADAFTAIDLEGAYLLGRLGLTPYFAMQARPLATRGVHAVASRDRAGTSEIMAALNQGLKRLKDSDAYSAIVQKHLTAMASPAPRPQSAAQRVVAQGATQGAAPKVVLQASPPQTQVAAVPPSPPAAQPPQQAAAKPAPLPTLDQAGREAALKYVTRGNEELAEGRVAPARLLYERAAEMGLAQAAMALAATYDAAEMNQPQLRNVTGDPAEAKRWYERALALGAAEAGARLQRLGSKE